MNQQTNVHLHDGDTVAVTGSILEVGNTPALSIDILGKPGDNTTIVLYLGLGPNEAWDALDALIDGARDLKARIRETPTDVPKPFGYARPTLVPEPGETTV